MSERGSFVTEYIYCDKCFAACKAVLLGREKYLCSTVVPAWSEHETELPIIAGKIGGLYGGEELHTFEFWLIPELGKVICHPVRLAVIAEQGQAFFTARPSVQPESRVTGGRSE